MQNYFRLVKEVMNCSFIIGKAFFIEANQESYKVEIVCINKDCVTFEVSSKNITPCGLLVDNSYKYYGEAKIRLGNKSKKEIILSAINSVTSNLMHNQNLNAIKLS